MLFLLRFVWTSFVRRRDGAGLVRCESYSNGGNVGDVIFDWGGAVIVMD